MGASVSYTYICPRCNEGVTSQDLNAECPGCGLELGKKEGVAPYTYPYTLSEQHYKHNDEKLLLEKLIQIPDEKALSILDDALNLMKIISAKKGPGDGIRSMIGKARAIGKLAETYASFIEAGGIHMPARLDNLKPQSEVLQNELLSETRTGENPSSSQPEVPKLPF